LANGFDTVGRNVAGFAEVYNNARFPTLSKRNEYTAAYFKVIAKVFGNIIGELSVYGRTQEYDFCVGHKSAI
jgi:hypothetical protein